jgi:DMSO/TMAO reductase YedYZ molybdopterin-dependent catalytic subunit
MSSRQRSSSGNNEETAGQHPPRSVAAVSTGDTRTTVTRRVQRVPADWPTLHLEDSIPEWTELVVDGLVRHRLRLDLSALLDLDAEQRNVPLHCVWGWSRPDPVWTGVGLNLVLDRAEPMGTHVTVWSASGVYSACLPIADARRGMLVWGRDGEPLMPASGGPLRFLGPPDHWGYKGVKWAARVTVGDRFVPGFWESKVADPVGRVPEGVELE